MNNQSILDYLSTHKFFSGLEENQLKFLAENANEMKIKRGEVLFQQDKPADTFYLLREGQISVQIPALVGPTLEIQKLVRNQLLGWSWLIPPYRWNFMARAEQDSDLIEFDGKAILDRCEEDTEFGYELFKRFASLMSMRLDAARQKMMDQWNPPGFA